MKFKEYYDALQEVIKNNPEIFDFDVVCSSDDEGNSFQLVSFTPGVGFFEPIDREFTPKEQFDEAYFSGNPNSICIN